jgi:hypothetical protein
VGSLTTPSNESLSPWSVRKCDSCLSGCEAASDNPGSLMTTFEVSGQLGQLPPGFSNFRPVRHCRYPHRLHATEKPPTVGNSKD